ncbi:ArnT family glycosyltransferase [Nocardia sp. CDC160]|uniref:ArnT family glycosyltransferase n=1 Tax=Nocardia sp. CDC160 TaxID=3112166 RepID=UPI002DB95846|nr:glycosyltransferase family 39 protein [Nocardia sp. CDC160]MEC3915639.1 glycosyltransferase family 39 protein [Nocardia sp. CDC160]
MTLTYTSESESSVAPPRFAWRGVVLVSGLITLAWSVSAARFQLAGDELYYLACGRRLAVDYVDNGPVIPLIARLCDLLAPGSVLALRIPGLLLLFAVSVLAAAVAFECGARPRYQKLAAAAYALSPFVVAFTVLDSVAFDVACQALILWLLVRWVRVRDDRLLLGVGVAAAIDVQDKWLVLMLAACVGLAMLAVGPREILRRPALWLGLLIFAVAMIPALLWQAARDWPQLATNAAIAQETAGSDGGQWGTIVAIMVTTGFLGGGLGLLGLYGLARTPRLRPYRFVLLAALLMIVLVVAGHGRSYYVAGIVPAIFGSGAAILSGLLEPPDARSHLRRLFTVLTVASAVLAAALAALPYPRSWIKVPDNGYWGFLQHYGNDDWADLADAVHRVAIGLPAEDRADTVVVTEAYNQAGALDHYRRSQWIPPVYSPNRGFAEFGAPPDSAGTVLYVGYNDGPQVRAFLAEFAHTTPALRMDNPLGIGGQNHHVTIWICREPRIPLSVAWPSLTYMIVPPA